MLSILALAEIIKKKKKKKENMHIRDLFSFKKKNHYSQIHPALQQIPTHSTLELCLLWLALDRDITSQNCFITLLFLFSRDADSRKGTFCPFCVPIHKKKKKKKKNTLGLVNRPNDISLSRANQSQAKFKSAVGRNLLQS